MPSFHRTRLNLSGVLRGLRLSVSYRPGPGHGLQSPMATPEQRSDDWPYLTSGCALFRRHGRELVKIQNKAQYNNNKPYVNDGRVRFPQYVCHSAFSTTTRRLITEPPLSENTFINEPMLLPRWR
ncbi:hypothetical protein DPMN_118908 [Dreissena polymorpha]|uniref:Uncharacterized protein n=1 Tax=Dreissena polymorpha TaxID=45954 RepID=A0A9D4GHP8_DREPO|nr:hypothetical protein DPMN_118908 [Dreissena polymorpha]